LTKQITIAKKNPAFNPRTFPSMIIGKDKEIVSFQKKETIFAQGDSPDEVVIMQCTIPTQQTTRIRERAYALYERRGRKSGQEEQDWLRAEREVLKQSQ
jgi:hypothetical protein